MLLAEFTRLPALARAIVLDGLSGQIDGVAEGAPSSHHFLRYQWYAAAIAHDDGEARTILVESDGAPVIALPITRAGHGLVRLAGVPGPCWPLRSFPAQLEAGEAAFDALLGALAREANGLLLGPVYAEDPTLVRLAEATRRRGWALIERPVPRAPAPLSLDDGFWALACTDPVVAETLNAARTAPEARGPRSEWLLVRPGALALLARLFAPFWRRSAG